MSNSSSPNSSRSNSSRSNSSGSRLTGAGILALSLAVLGASGCAKADADDCDKLARKITELAIAEIPNTDGSAPPEDRAAKLRPALVARCLEDPPSASQIECILAVTHEDQIPDC